MFNNYLNNTSGNPLVHLFCFFIILYDASLLRLPYKIVNASNTSITGLSNLQSTNGQVYIRNSPAYLQIFGYLQYVCAGTSGTVSVSIPYVCGYDIPDNAYNYSIIGAMYPTNTIYCHVNIGRITISKDKITLSVSFPSGSGYGSNFKINFMLMNHIFDL